VEAGAPRVLPEGGHRAASTRRADQPTLADLSLPAEVALDRIPERVGESERLRAVLWARLTRDAADDDDEGDRAVVYFAEPIQSGYV